MCELMGGRRGTPFERVMRYVVEDPSGCWLFQGSRAKGYGRVKVPDRVEFAHRISYEALVGPIPDGLVIDHLCRVRNCVNPAHLEPVTAVENTHRGRPTHCPRGHDMTGDNRYRRPDGDGGMCQECTRLRRRADWREMANCRDIEVIASSMGGGHMCRCDCGQLRLHGRPWSWWRCPVCALR